ncbi:aldo/keto reductase [Phenylobacterium deserti]|uniref:Aldo/keto reductase n=1 Tax=Phenylobacterium deserti TaxID=1914756 RepID=A0A328ASC0_9CAUL|nr:aldo/keto reductase [Phenylobacterium deserti]RAK57962.1 aldo/keto reductase [Phenylobacterium deserti]
MVTSADRIPLGPLSVTRQGFGCMGLSHAYGRADEVESLRTLDRAIELGINFFDTADVYGQGHNEDLLARAIVGRRKRLVIASKFGNRLDRETSGRQLDGRPEYVRTALEGSLRRLGIDHVDLYYLHRLDPQTPIEDTVGELARLKAEGKIGAIGLSEVDAPTLRRAHATAPIAALQSEYSLWTREVEAEILPTARELGVGFVAYSPLGRGFLAGSVPTEAEDRRNIHPRFKPDAVQANSKRRAVADGLAERLGITSAQLALAWVLSKGVVPIPGTRHIKHLESNWAAGEIELHPAHAAELEAAFPPGSTVGARYPAGAPAVPGLSPQPA